MNQLTNALRREISSLAQAKGRRRAGAFAAEGTKCVLDTLGHFTLRHLVCTRQWAAEHPGVVSEDTFIVTRDVLGEISSMSLAPDVVAVYELPPRPGFDAEALAGSLTLALDRVQDPGNLGTIMRTADWLGVDTILASDDTADCFNPKSVQATMGAISRVKVVYGDLPRMLDRLVPGTAVCGTFLDGSNIFDTPLPQSAVLVMGNEGAGISDEVALSVTHRLLIPSWPAGRPTSESLNVATATAIALTQFRYGKKQV